MIFLAKGSDAIADAATKVLSRLPDKYLGNYTAEYAKVRIKDGEENEVENGAFAQDKKEDIKESLEDLLETSGCVILNLETESDDDSAFKNSGVWEIHGTPFMLVGKHMATIFDHFKEMPDKWGEWAGCLRLLDEKLNNYDKAFVLDVTHDYLSIIGGFSVEQIVPDLWYKEIVIPKVTNAYESSYTPAPWCVIHRASVKKGGTYYKLDPKQWTGPMLGTVYSDKPVLCDACFSALRRMKEKKFLKEVYNG